MASAAPKRGAQRARAAPDHHRQEDRRWRSRRSSWRRVEGRLCRLRDRDDGVLPAAVDSRRDHREAAQGHRRLFQPDARPDAREVGGRQRAVRRRQHHRQGPLSAQGRANRFEEHHHPQGRLWRPEGRRCRDPIARQASTSSNSSRSLQQRIAANKALNGLAPHIRFTETPEGLRIDIVDGADFSMFALGSDTSSPRARRN